MSRRMVVIGALVVILLAGLVAGYLLTRPQPTDEQKINALVVQAQQAVEKHNTTGLTRLISRDYVDKSGVTRQQLVAMIAQWTRGGEAVTVVPEITGLRINGAFADMQVRAQVWYGPDTSGGGQEYRITARLRKEGRDWKVISAEGWEAAQSDAMSQP